MEKPPEEYEAYLSALAKGRAYLIDPVGLSKFDAIGIQDKTLIKQNNTIILLLLDIIDRMNRKEELERSISEITEKLNAMTTSKKSHTKIKKP